MELRAYQKECIDTVNKLPEGSRSVVVLATGLGKTVVAANFDFGGRVLWLSHRDELVRQPEKYFKDSGLTYGIEKAEQHSNGEDIVSASIQSISRDNRLSTFDPNEFSMIICDEAHHAAAPTYRKVLDYFHPKKLIGLTATPKRGDGARLSDVFDDICFVKDLKWGIQNGYLSPIRCMRVQANFDMDNIKKTAGDFTLSDMEKEMEDSDDHLVVAKAYLETCIPENRQTLIYCPTIKVCETVFKTIRFNLPEEERGTVQMLSDKTDHEERTKILSDYKEGKVHCIVNCMILTEGTDLPETSAIINNRPTANDTLYQQIVGRGTRIAEDKEYCLIIDIVGENTRAKSICTAPTLFGVDPDLVPEKVIRSLEDRDLLEACEEITEEHARKVKNVHLVKEMIDIFTQERVDIIEKNKKKGYDAVADEYAKTLENQISDIDFGDIVVTKQPYQNHRYQISATFHGKIWFSEPDMIGNTIMEYDIPANELNSTTDVCFISDKMKMTDAIQFTTDFLDYIVPDFYASCWSKKAREVMDKSPATEKQIWRVESEYWNVTKHKITKRQASDLINLNLDIQDLEVKKRQLEMAEEDGNKKRRGKILEKWLAKKEMEEKAEKEEIEEKKKAFEKLYHDYQGNIARKKKIRKEKEEKLRSMIGKSVSVNIDMDYDYEVDTPHPSEKQLGFLSSLIAKCEQHGFVFDIEPSPTALKLDMWHTGFLINYMKQFSNLPSAPVELQFKCNLLEYIVEIKKIPEIKPTKIVCTYLVEEKTDDSETA